MKRRLLFLLISACFIFSLMSVGMVDANWYKRGEIPHDNDEQMTDSVHEPNENAPLLEENQEYLPAEEENNVPEINQEDSPLQEYEPVQQEEQYQEQEEIQNQETGEQ